MVGMRLITLFGLVFFGALSLSAQGSHPPVLPNQLDQWTADKEAKPVHGPNDPFGGIVSFPKPVLKEAGLEDVEIRFYNGVEVALFRFTDPSGAYSAATYRPYIPPGAVPAKAVQVVDHGHQAQVGNYLIVVAGDPSLDDQAKRVLAAVTPIVQKVADQTPLPPIRDYLPGTAREPNTDIYVLGPTQYREAASALGRIDAAILADEAGFKSHAEAMLAKYKTAKDEATLLLLEYPTPQLAELHLRHLQRALADAKLTTSSIERKGSLLSIVLAPTSPEYADKLRAGVNYETQVTWNEPSSTATDPPITSTLVKIIIATFVFMGVTLVLGIAFGGVRVITKRLFPGKVFDRKEQIEVLQLGLSGKPIDPTDLY
jgi:hypothetical protein